MKDLLKQIEEDNTSGALALTLKGAEVLDACADEISGLSFQNAKAALIETALRLVGAKPLMASIFNLANAVLLASDKAESTKELCWGIKKTVEEFSRSLRENTQAIAAEASKLIKKKIKVMTNSFSGTVFEAFKVAKEKKEFQVICPESRPMREGAEMARRLGEIGVSVTLIADALAPSLVGEVDLVMVGGDALSPQGLINKIGTYGIALAAQRFNIKFLALLGTEKFIPFLVKSIPQMDPAELLPNPQKINVCNRYFELTPLDLIWGVICENGIIGGKQISKQLPQLQVHEALQG